jgi:hypothetical protein
MTWGFVAGSVVSLGAAAISADSARSAANTQSDAANRATDLQWQQYQQNRQDQMPWMQAGQQALAKLTGLLNSGDLTSKFAPKDLQNEPGYQFGLKQGQQSLDYSGAARGAGGAALKAAAQYGNDYAGTKYNEAFNRFQTEQQNIQNPLFRLAGLGSTANQQVGMAGMNYANQAGQDYIGGANAQAAAGVARGNIYGNALGQIGALASRYPWGGATTDTGYGSVSGGYVDPYTGMTYNNPSAYGGP